MKENEENLLQRASKRTTDTEDNRWQNETQNVKNKRKAIVTENNWVDKGKVLVTKAPGEITSGMYICLWLWAAVKGMHVHKGTSVHLRSLQATWPNKIDAKAAISWCNLVKLSTDLDNTINQLDLADIYRTLHPTTEFTFFPGTCGTFTNVDHILDHGTNLNKLKLKSYKYVFSSHHVIILEIGNKDNKKFSVYLEIRQPTSK